VPEFRFIVPVLSVLVNAVVAFVTVTVIAGVIECVATTGEVLLPMIVTIKVPALRPENVHVEVPGVAIVTGTVMGLQASPIPAKAEVEFERITEPWKLLILIIVIVAVVVLVVPTWRVRDDMLDAMLKSGVAVTVRSSQLLATLLLFESPL
jgi:hypothetical protein